MADPSSQDDRQELHKQVEAAQAKLLQLMQLIESSVSTSEPEPVEAKSLSDPATPVPCATSQPHSSDPDVENGVSRLEQMQGGWQTRSSSDEASSAGEGGPQGQADLNDSVQALTQGGACEGAPAGHQSRAIIIQNATRGFLARKQARERRQQPRPSSAQWLLDRLRAGQVTGAEAALIYSRRPAAVVRRLREERQHRGLTPQSSKSDQEAD